MSWLPDDVREASGGEVVDRAARDAVRLAHRALDRFPDLVRRHKFIAGGAAISSSLVVLAGVAVARRMRKGESAEDAVNRVTEQELQGYIPGDEDEGGDLNPPEEPQTPRANGTVPVSANGHTPAAGADATPSH